MTTYHLNLDAMEDRFVKSYAELSQFEAALSVTFPDPDVHAIHAAKLADDRAVLLERMQDDLVECGVDVAVAAERVAALVVVAGSLN